jgi:hypothetical protein
MCWRTFISAYKPVKHYPYRLIEGKWYIWSKYKFCSNLQFLVPKMYVVPDSSAKEGQILSKRTKRRERRVYLKHKVFFALHRIKMKQLNLTCVHLNIILASIHRNIFAISWQILSFNTCHLFDLQHESILNFYGLVGRRIISNYLLN